MEEKTLKKIEEKTCQKNGRKNMSRKNGSKKCTGSTKIA
jgi:hypothetical protein